MSRLQSIDTKLSLKNLKLSKRQNFFKFYFIFRCFLLDNFDYSFKFLTVQ